MDPDIPQALRLQAILVGGVVIIYNKQTAFLLDDCNDTLVGMGEWLGGWVRGG